MQRLRVKEILEGDKIEAMVGQEIIVKGWIRTIRRQKSLAFVEVNDGSSRQNLQAVCDGAILKHSERRLGKEREDYEMEEGLKPETESSSFEKMISSLSTGASVCIIGIIKDSPGKRQRFELTANRITVVGSCENDYPLQKKRHSLEFLRNIAHLRPRTNTIAAVARVRSSLAFATHEYFQQLGFHYLQSPLITVSDCEVGGSSITQSIRFTKKE
jgi:asparaginyl-tRNA synthetase